MPRTRQMLWRSDVSRRAHLRAQRHHWHRGPRRGRRAQLPQRCQPLHSGGVMHRHHWNFVAPRRDAPAPLQRGVQPWLGRPLLASVGGGEKKRSLHRMHHPLMVHHLRMKNRQHGMRGFRPHYLVGGEGAYQRRHQRPPRRGEPSRAATMKGTRRLMSEHRTVSHNYLNALKWVACAARRKEGRHTSGRRSSGRRPVPRPRHLLLGG